MTKPKPAGCSTSAKTAWQCMTAV